MQVSDLSTELGVPDSAILESCRRLGIDAPRAGSELSEADAGRLRSDVALARPAVVPPTAVGSLPGFADGDADPSPGHADGTEPSRAAKRVVDRRARAAAILAALAVVALIASEQVRNPFVIAGLWVSAFVLLVGCLVVARRAWRRARVHGDKYRGSWLAAPAAVVAVAGLVGLGLAVATVVGDEPAADAPMGIGELDSVQRARWGYQRTMLLKGDGWTRPAKVAGSCWIVSQRERDQDNRPEERIEVGNVSVSCNAADHTVACAAMTPERTAPLLSEG